MTLYELKERIAAEYDSITILEMLDLEDSYDLVEALSDRIEQYQEYFREQFEEEEDDENY
jgi:hypothetical protein